MWIILVAGTLAFLSTCNAGRQATSVNSADTILLHKIDTLLVTSNVPTVLQCRFSKNRLSGYNSSLKTLLILENPTLVTAPEGVYEVYITPQPPEIDRLSSSQPGFVTVLDLYSPTAPGTQKRLEVDISESIKNLFLSTQSQPAAYISIRFGPIKLLDGTYSSKAGELRLKGIQIVQIKN